MNNKAKHEKDAELLRLMKELEGKRAKIAFKTWIKNWLHAQKKEKRVLPEGTTNRELPV